MCWGGGEGRQLAGVGSFLRPCGIWVLNSGRQASWQAPLPTEPSHWAHVLLWCICPAPLCAFLCYNFWKLKHVNMTQLKMLHSPKGNHPFITFQLCLSTHNMTGICQSLYQQSPRKPKALFVYNGARSLFITWKTSLKIYFVWRHTCPWQDFYLRTNVLSCQESRSFMSLYPNPGCLKPD